MTITRRRSLKLLASAAGGATLASLLACQSQRRPRSPGGRRRIGILEYVSVPAIDITFRGVMEGLAEKGFRPGLNLEVLKRQAGGSPSLCRRQAHELAALEPDLLVAIGTPALLAAIAAAPRELPIVFCYCANPWGAGAGGSATDHLANVTGTVTTTAVSSLLRVAQTVVTDLRQVGVVYNPAEPNSSFEAELLAQAVAMQQMQLHREAVSRQADLPKAVSRLQQQGVQALIKVEDYVTLAGFAQLAELALKARIPLFSDEPDDIAVPGNLAVVGWTSQQDGRRAGALAGQVLQGVSPATIPIQPPGEPGLWLNLRTARRLGISFPASLLDQAIAVSS